MTIVSIICFSLFLVLLVSLIREGADIYSPARLFVLVWSVAIGLTDLKLSWIQLEWSTYSWIMLIVTLLSFLLGTFVVYIFNFKKTVYKIDDIRNILYDKPLNADLVFKYSMFLFIAYCISYLASYLIIGFVPIFTIYPGLFRNDWGVFGFGLFVQSFPAIMYLIVLYFIIEKKNKVKKSVLGFAFLITFVTYGFLLQRYYVVFAIILTMVTMYYMSRFFRIRNVILIMIVMFFIIWGMSFVRFSTTVVNYLYYISQMKFSVKYAAFTEPYMYITMNLENFAQAVDKLNRFTFGEFTFDFVFAITGLKHLLFEYLNLSEFPHLISVNYNTYTSFFIYYRDFGPFGLITFPFVFGVIFSSTYYKMRRRPDVHTISIYSIFVFVILFSFFIPIVSFLHFVFNLLVIYFVTKKIAYKK